MEFIKLLDALVLLFCSLIWMASALWLRSRRHKSGTYLLFFTLFYIYIVKILDYTLFEFQSLLLIKLFVPNLMLRGETAVQSLNLIPLLTLTDKDVKTSFLNVLLMLPFGFGLPFITNFNMKRVVVVGALFSLFIELMQFLTGLLEHMTFRVADVNDVIFNVVGVMVGYVSFIWFMHLFRRLFPVGAKSANPIVQHITKRSQEY